MLNRTSLIPLLAPPGLVSLGQRWLAGPTSGLLKFLSVLVIISGLTCLYVWQASTITAIENNTAAMCVELAELERRNVALMLQVAQWNAPSHIESQSQWQGMMPAPQPIYVAVPGSAAVSSGTGNDQLAKAWWAWLTGWLPHEPVMPHLVQLP
jgi:hypothetical protein